MQNLTPFQQSLLPASFRGVFFFVVDASLRSGLRVAEHQYPYRNTPYSEPMGKQARQYVFDGFLVGDNVADQYSNLLQAVEQDTAATLVHPTLGQLQVVCVGAEFTQNLGGRYVECRLSFVEAGSVINPGSSDDTQAQTQNTVTAAQTTSQTQFTADMTEWQDGVFPSPSTTTAMNPPAIGDQGIEFTVPSTQIPAQATETYNQAGDNAVLTNQDNLFNTEAVVHP